MDRYAEELHRPHKELAAILERIRVRKLMEAEKLVVSTVFFFFLPSVSCFKSVGPLIVHFKTIVIAVNL